MNFDKLGANLRSHSGYVALGFKDSTTRFVGLGRKAVLAQSSPVPGGTGDRPLPLAGEGLVIS
jgi:hypothetical protein